MEHPQILSHVVSKIGGVHTRWVELFTQCNILQRVGLFCRGRDLLIFWHKRPMPSRLSLCLCRKALIYKVSFSVLGFLVSAADFFLVERGEKKQREEGEWETVKREGRVGLVLVTGIVFIVDSDSLSVDVDGFIKPHISLCSSSCVCDCFLFLVWFTSVSTHSRFGFVVKHYFKETGACVCIC